MCGICGIFEPGQPATISGGGVKAMADTLHHRGPDDEGFYCGPGIGLGHRRLSIIDLEGGHQPLANEDESVWVVFNGEIYNFEDLNCRYLQAGHHFRTRSDTETIVHLYEEFGQDCFAKLEGMFAIALWDARRRRLLLARDRLGKKPLYYSWTGKRLLFGSEMKALLAVKDFSPEIDAKALSDYFSFQYIPAPKTIYRQIRKVRAAHYLVIDAGGIREIPYWDLRFDRVRQRCEPEWADCLLQEYRRAVKCRLVSDVPLGAFLSSGVDSSSVVALMNEFQDQVTTCSVGFTEHGYNEADDAKTFATSLQAIHFEHIVIPQAVDLIEKLVWHYDEPFADASAIPTYYVSNIARQHVTVALSGDGGDESFAGYRRYKFDFRENQIRSFLPASVRRNLFGRLGEWYPKADWAPRIFRAKTTFQSLAGSPLEGYFRSVSTFPPELKSELLAPDFQQTLYGYDSMDVLQYYYDRADTSDPLSRIQYVDVKTYLVDDILVKVDRASMANSLEVRCPLLDHKLMELAAEIPSNLKLHRGRGKYIFKKALEAILPGSILRRQKQGFSVPVAEWFRGELKSFAYETLFHNQDQYLNYAFLLRCWKQHQSHRRDWWPLLWSALMFRTWQRVCQPN